MFRSVAARALQRPAQDGAFGSGSHRNDDAPGHASGRSRRHRRTTAVSGSACRTADGALLLRPYGSLPGVTFQARSHRSRQSGSIASLLSVLALPQRPVSGRCRTRYKEHGIFSGSASHAGRCGARGSFRSRATADGTAGGPGSDQQSRGANYSSYASILVQGTGFTLR